MRNYRKALRDLGAAFLRGDARHAESATVRLGDEGQLIYRYVSRGEVMVQMTVQPPQPYPSTAIPTASAATTIT